MEKKAKMLIPIIIVLAVTVITIFVMLGNKSSDSNLIDKGVTINGVDVGGMTKEEASNVINEKFNSKFKDKVIKMTFENRNFYIDYKALKVHYDVDTAVEEAFKYGKDRNFFSNALRGVGIGQSSYNVNLNFVADTSIVGKSVKDISKKINRAPKDAKLSFKNGIFETTADKSGIMVDEVRLADAIVKSIKPGEGNIDIKIPMEITKAKVTAEVLSKIDTELSSYTTSFRASDAERTGNIKIAANAVDDTVIFPGEVFSMNKAVGPRVESKGYKEAKIIVNGELVPGLAGGICQVTTTVYNAAILSNMEIVQRRAHALKIAYVGPGRDATISGSYIDLKFKNINKYPIYLHTYVKGGSITAKIYGADEHPNQTVRIKTEVLEKTPPPETEYIKDPTLYVGTRKVDSKPAQGMRSITYRMIYEGGKLIKNEVLSKDRYKPAAGKILIGTKPINR